MSEIGAVAQAKPIVGMIHIDGWPHDGSDSSIEATGGGVLTDARTLVEAGFTHIMVQNLGSRSDWRHERPEEIAVMSTVLAQLRAAHPLVVFGLNLPSDDPQATLAIAYATGAEFVRIKVWIGTMRRLEGTLDGCAYAALRYRRELRAEHIEIWSDVLDRTGDPAWPTEFARAVDEADFAGATTLVITAADHPQLLDRLRVAADVAPHLRRIVGGGATAENLGELLELADGVIVGGALQEKSGARRVSLEAARRFIAARGEPS